MSDFNYLSCSNGIWGMYEGGGPTDPPVVIMPTGFMPTALMPTNSTQYAGILKLADNSNVSLTGLTVAQGCESSVDINNRVNATLSGAFGANDISGEQVISLKGGSSLTLLNATLCSKGTRISADILIDNWSDQSYTGSHLYLGTYVAMWDKSAIRITKRFFASTVESTGLCDYRINIFASWKLTAYWWLKWTVRKILGIKVGESGPSWL